MKSVSPVIFEQTELNCPVVSLETSNAEFIDQLCSHIQQLCLTKTSLQTISDLCNDTKMKVCKGSSCKPIFIDFFNQVAQFCNTIILRLKKLDNRKFQPLIKKKLIDIFGCVMRYSYDLKMISLADKANELKRMAKLSTSFCSLQILMCERLNEPFRRIKSIGHLEPQIKEEIYKNKFLNVMWKMDFILKSRQQIQLQKYLLSWHLRVKESNLITNNVVVNQTRQLFVQLAGNIDNPELLHQKIINSFKEFCKIDRIEFFKYSNNQLISYSDKEDITSDRSSLQSCTRQSPHGLYKQCIQTQEMVTEQLDHVTSRLFIPLQHTSTIGLVVMTYQNNSLDWKQIQLLLNYCKNISEILAKIYQTQSRLSYYSHSQPSVDSISKTVHTKYSQYNPTLPTFKTFLDDIFTYLKVDDIEVSFIGESSLRFYGSNERFDSLRDKEFLSLLNSEFKYLHKDVIQIKRSNHSQSVIAIRDHKELIGYVRYIPTVVSSAVLTPVIKGLVLNLLQKLKNEQGLLKTTTSRPTDPIDSTKINRCFNVLMSRSFDQIQNNVKTEISSFNGRLYGCIIWKHHEKYFSNISGKPQYLQQNLVQKIKLNREYQQSVYQFSSTLSVFLRNFPCFQQNKLHEYENHNKNMIIHHFNFQNFQILVGGFEEVLCSKEIVHVSSIDPRVPYQDLMELGKHITIRLNKGYINQDYSSNPLLLKNQLSIISQFIQPQQNFAKKKSNQKLINLHGKYLCYQNHQSNTFMNPLKKTNKNNVDWRQCIDSIVRLQAESLSQTSINTLLKQKLVTLNLLSTESHSIRLMKIVDKFRRNCSKKQSKQKAIKQLIQSVIKKHQMSFVSEIFNEFKKADILYQQTIQKKELDALSMVEKLQLIYKIRVFCSLKQTKTIKEKTKNNQIQKLTQIIKNRRSNISNSKKCVIMLMRQFSLKTKETQEQEKSKAMLWLNLMMQNKIKRQYKSLFEEMRHQSVQFYEAISVIIEEISLVRMGSYKSLLCFIQSRLSLHLSRQINSPQIYFQITALKASQIKETLFYSYLINSPHILVMHLEGQQYISAAITVPAQTYFRQLHRLLTSVRTAITSIRQNIKRRLSLFCKILSKYEATNCRKAISVLFTNLSECCKKDLIGSYQMSREAQQRLVASSLVSSGKQNIDLNNQITVLKRQIQKNNKVIETQKLQNKIKRKTLATAFMQLKDIEQQTLIIKRKEGFNKIVQRSLQNNKDVKKEQLICKLINSGMKTVIRFMKSRKNISLKNAFNRIMNEALDN